MLTTHQNPPFLNLDNLFIDNKSADTSINELGAVIGAAISATPIFSSDYVE